MYDTCEISIDEIVFIIYYSMFIHFNIMRKLCLSTPLFMHQSYTFISMHARFEEIYNAQLQPAQTLKVGKKKSRLKTSPHKDKMVSKGNP
jgi:hypothetical protein